MKELRSVTFQYHQRTYELVKFKEVDSARWAVYDYSVDGRGATLFGFTCAGFTPSQAEHMAKHIMLNYDSGVQAGRHQVKQELKNLVDTELE